MNIIAMENFKMFKDKSIRILLTVSIICFFGLGILMKLGSETDGASIVITGMTAPYSIVSFITFVIFFCGIIAGTNVVSDFDRGTIRNALSTGTSKVSYYLSKLYTMFLSCFILTVASTVIFTISVTIFVGWNGDISGYYILNLLVFYVVLLLHLFSYCSLFVMIAFLIRNVGGVLAITMLCTGIESIIIMILTLPNISFLNIIAENMPSIVISSLLQFVEADMVMTLDFAMKAIPALIIIAITISVGIMSFHKTDIK